MGSGQHRAADFPAGRGLLVYAIRVTDKKTMAEYDAWYCVSEKSGASWCTGTSENTAGLLM